MANDSNIWIARDFSPFPAGRTPKDGPFNGQRFREEVLRPLLERGENVTIHLDGVAGLPSSFLEEIFGGLVRKHILTIGDFGTRLSLKTNESHLQWYIPIALRYAKDAASKLQ